MCFRGQCLNGTDCSDTNLALTNTEGAAAYQECAVLGSLVLDNFAQPELPAFENLKGILGDVFVRGAPGINMGYPNSLNGIASVEWIGGHLKVESVFPDDADAVLGTRVSLPHLSRIGLGEPGLDEGLIVENVEHFGLSLIHI